MIEEVRYEEDKSGEAWFCRTHGRKATHLFYRMGSKIPEHHCNPNLGGIMLPCDCIKKE